MNPRKGFPLAEILRVSLMREGLALEGDVAVGLEGVETVLDKSDKVLEEVEKEEEDEEQFALLVGVNHFVGDLMRQELAPSTLHEDDAEEVDAVKVAWRKVLSVDDAHGAKVF